jgi:hypothetical protein
MSQVVTGVTFRQSAVATGCTAADYSGMNSGTAVPTNDETAMPSTPAAWIDADTGAVQYIEAVVLGWDYTNALPGGPWPLDGATLSGSVDDVNWSTIGAVSTAGAVNGLVTVPVQAAFRYLLVSNWGAALGLTEFSVLVPGGGVSVIVNPDWRLCVNAATVNAGDTVALPVELAHDWEAWGSVHAAP